MIGGMQTISVKKISSHVEGCCHSCNLGLFDEEEINEVRVGVMTFRICDKCKEELIKKLSDKI